MAISFSSLPGVAHAVCLERGLGIGLGKIRSRRRKPRFPCASTGEDEKGSAGHCTLKPTVLSPVAKNKGVQQDEPQEHQTGC